LYILVTEKFPFPCDPRATSIHFRRNDLSAPVANGIGVWVFGTSNILHSSPAIPQHCHQLNYLHRYQLHRVVNTVTPITAI
jgi:hypothetical protein